MLNNLVAVAPALSVTCTVKLVVSAVVGIPLMTPAASRTSPVGRVPEARLQVYGAFPPTTERV